MKTSMAELEPMKTDLPPDIVFSNILPRLPAKSISCFKCVSKKWNSFLRTPDFLQMHHHHVINGDCQNHKLLFLPTAQPWEFRTVDCETPQDGLTARRPFPFEIGPGQKIKILTSLHGMVCVGIMKRRPNHNEYSHIILWNPMTIDYKILSKAGSPAARYRHYCFLTFELYFSSSENDYKLVCLIADFTNKNNYVYIYSLKSDSWRKVDSPGGCSNPVLHKLMSSVYSNEKFHFLRELFEFEGDFTAEKSRDIATPLLAKETTDFMGFMVVKGCIHFCVAILNSIGEYGQIEFWRKDENGSWEVVTSSRSPNYIYKHVQYHSRPLHMMRNGNWLMYSSHNEYVYTVDTKKQAQKIMCSINYVFRPKGKYMETLVSPNQYIK
ncbi:hypothetical protein LXL04_002920 [Taraxacum kok-saghyz]